MCQESVSSKACHNLYYKTTILKCLDMTVRLITSQALQLYRYKVY